MGVTGGLGPTGLGAMAQQQCAIVDKDNQDTSWSIFAIVVLVVCMDVLLSKLAFRTWKWVDQKIKTLENIIHGVSCGVHYPCFIFPCMHACIVVMYLLLHCFHACWSCWFSCMHVRSYMVFMDVVFMHVFMLFV